MRKLLLASVAVLGASVGVASVGHAQAPSPAPGTISVRLNGLVRFYANYVSDHDANNNQDGYVAAGNPTLNGLGTTSPAGVVTASSGGNKLSKVSFLDYARLYPGFDGVAANGLKYGGSLEIRQDQNHGAGGGTYGSISGQDSARGTLYFRREFGYVGTDQLGTVRVGSTDQPSSLYMTGNFENFDGGGLNGDITGQAAAPTQITWPFADVGGVYTTTKIVYLSPQFFGFDFGVSYEPTTGNVNSNNGCGSSTYVGANFINAQGAVGTATAAGALVNGAAQGASTTGAAGPGCDRLASTATSDYSRRRNTFDGLLRYRGSFGPLGVAATAGYITSGRVLDSATPQRAIQYDDLSVGDFGLALTYAGFSVGGKYQFGRFQGSALSLVQKGGSDGEAWLAGASYTIGPFVTGVHYLNYKYSGNYANAILGRQHQDRGFAAGATYSLVPGVTLFASYAFQHARQNGVNQVTGESAAAGGPITGGAALHNQAQSNVFGVGTSFRW